MLSLHNIWAFLAFPFLPPNATVLPGPSSSLEPLLPATISLFHCTTSLWFQVLLGIESLSALSDCYFISARLPREMPHSGRWDLHSFSHQIAQQSTRRCCSVTTHEKSCRAFLFAQFAIKWAVDVSSISLYPVCSVLSVEMHSSQQATLKTLRHATQVNVQCLPKKGSVLVAPTHKYFFWYFGRRQCAAILLCC